MKSIDIHKTLYKIGDFISWYKNDALILNPGFQRRSVWKPGTKSFLIDTIVKGFPIPIIFLRERGVNLKTYEPIREVIDGQQRLRTLISYIDIALLKDANVERDLFQVKTVHNKELANKGFKEISADNQQRILNYQFSVHTLPSYVDDRDVIQIFRRMNSTNYTLNAQELRNAEFFGEFKTSAYQLAMEQLNRWREWKTFTEDNIARMFEVELTSELMFSLIRGNIVGKSQTAISKVYKDFDEEFPNRDEIERRFRVCMDEIDSKLGASMPNIVFSRRSIIYSLFMYIYDVIFGLDTPLNQPPQPNTLSREVVANVKLASERIASKTTSEIVLNAITRRSSNPFERNIIFKYLHNRPLD